LTHLSFPLTRAQVSFPFTFPFFLQVSPTLAAGALAAFFEETAREASRHPSWATASVGDMSAKGVMIARITAVRRASRLPFSYLT
jgi:hypothetical protein